MKHQFLKSALIFGSVFAVMNCSDDAANAVNTIDPGTGSIQPTDSLPPEENPSTTAANDSCYLFSAGQDLLIYPMGIVTDAAGNVIGTFEADTIKYADGTPIAVGIDLNNLTKTTPCGG